MQSSGGKHPQVPQKEKQDTLTRQQASLSAIERKTRCNHQAASIFKYHRKKNKMQSPSSKHPQVPQKEKQDAITRRQASSSAIERKTRCNHQAASILNCHRKKNLQVPQKEKQDAIIGLQAFSSTIERKTRCNYQAASIFKCNRKKKQDAIIGRQVSSSTIERKTRYNHRAASIFKCHRKKSKIQSSGGKYPQVLQKEKQDTIAYQGSSSKYGKYKLRMRLFIVNRNKSSAYELTM